ncbi:MAG TPA: FtsX-like permease family protein, partial [Candidatus Wirthbacteria bacterium]|nr:FtsX-like permease family protein [Candidatus Wirthbacteria bacterium]
PSAMVNYNPATTFLGLGAATASCLISCFIPAMTAVRLQPAAAMRGESPLGGGRRSWLEFFFLFKNLSPTNKMILRGVGRNPKRSVSAVLGIAFAMVLVMTSLGLQDTAKYFLDKVFNRTYLEDLSVQLSVPLDRDELAEVFGTEGIARVEPVLAVPIVVYRGEEDQTTHLLILDEDSQMRAFWDQKDNQMSLDSEGIFLWGGFRNILGLNPGDQISLGIDPQVVGRLVEAMQAETAQLDNQMLQAQSFRQLLINMITNKRFFTQVAGFVDEPIGSMVYSTWSWLLPDLERLGLEEKVTMAYVQVKPNQLGQVRERLNALPQVQSIEDRQILYTLTLKMLDLFYFFVRVMFVFGILMALGLIFNTVSVNIIERTREIATLRTMGFTYQRINSIVTAENLLLVTLALPLGIYGGFRMSEYALSFFNNESFNFHLFIYPASYGVLVAGIIATALISQIPALFAMRKLDLAKLIKERTS